MAANKVIQLLPAQAAGANLQVSTVAAELSAGGAAAGARVMLGAEAASMVAASPWAPVGLLCAAVSQQTSHIAAAIASRAHNIAGANEQAVTDMLNTDEQNRQTLTEVPGVWA